MDSKVVNKYIRTIIKPELENKGFIISSTRSFWRYSDKNINVINFQSFNSYNAEVMNITTYSFIINLGLYNLDIKTGESLKTKNDHPLPEEHECHFRGCVKRSIKQKHSDQYVYFIENDGSNVEVCIHDALKQIKTYGIEWFDKLNNNKSQLDIILNNNEKMRVLWGWGRNPSPIRSLMLANLFYKQGNNAAAMDYLTEAQNSGCFNRLFKTIEEGIKYLEG